jgi:flagellar biosynthesis anti-sigma factor FlgM
MRINDPNMTAAGAAGLGSTKAVDSDHRAQKRPNVGGGQGASDQIQLSQLAESLAVEQPESAERAAKLERLRVAVEKGQYKPDPEEIAKGLVKEATATGK